MPYNRTKLEMRCCRKRKQMKRTFTASIWREDDWYVAQCLEVDVASQGETRDEALANLREALELHFEPPTPVAGPEIERLEVEIGAA
jgi:predicted RNase H-like HicB family nuclease